MNVRFDAEADECVCVWVGGARGHLRPTMVGKAIYLTSTLNG